jgi:hypothetical protein
MAVAAVEDSPLPSPLDLDIDIDIDSGPTDLSLDVEDRQEDAVISHHRCLHHELDRCITCGQPLRNDCSSPGVAGDHG